jgi:hypothetical protein
VSKKAHPNTLIFGFLYGNGNYIGMFGQFQHKIKPNDSLQLEHMLRSIRVGNTSLHGAKIKPLAKNTTIAKAKRITKGLLAHNKIKQVGKKALAKKHPLAKHLLLKGKLRKIAHLKAHHLVHTHAVHPRLTIKMQKRYI